MEIVRVLFEMLNVHINTLQQVMWCKPTCRSGLSELGIATCTEASVLEVGFPLVSAIPRRFRNRCDDLDLTVCKVQKSLELTV